MSSSKRSIPLVAVALLAASFSVAAGCSKETSAAPEPATNPSPAAQPKEAPGGEARSNDPAPAPKFSEANFDLEIRPVGTYEAGKAGAVEVVLASKGVFKCNDKYPYKLQLDETAGVKYPNLVLKKDAAAVEKEKVVMEVPFTPETKGAKKISGRFSFSVCTEDKCLIEKRKLALDVTVN